MPAIALGYCGSFALFLAAPFSKAGEERPLHGCGQNFRPRRLAGLRFHGEQPTSTRHPDIKAKTASRIFLGQSEIVGHIAPVDFNRRNEFAAPDPGANGGNGFSAGVDTPTSDSQPARVRAPYFGFLQPKDKAVGIRRGVTDRLLRRNATDGLLDFGACAVTP